MAVSIAPDAINRVAPTFGCDPNREHQAIGQQRPRLRRAHVGQGNKELKISGRTIARRTLMISNTTNGERSSAPKSGKIFRIGR